MRLLQRAVLRIMTEATLDSNTLQRIEREVAALKPSVLAPDRVDWSNGPDAGKLWVPEELTPLPQSPLYDQMTAEQRLTYNHYFALELAEEFIWLETNALVPQVTMLLKGAVPSPAFRTLLESFVIDEANHGASVWMLLRYDVWSFRTAVSCRVQDCWSSDLTFPALWKVRGPCCYSRMRPRFSVSLGPTSTIPR